MTTTLHGWLQEHPELTGETGFNEVLFEDVVVPDTYRVDEIGKVLTWPATHDEVEAASKLVPDEVVQMITASGTPDEVLEKVQHYVDNGCTCPILYPLGDVTAMIDAFS